MEAIVKDCSCWIGPPTSCQEVGKRQTLFFGPLPWSTQVGEDTETQSNRLGVEDSVFPERLEHQAGQRGRIQSMEVTSKIPNQLHFPGHRDRGAPAAFPPSLRIGPGMGVPEAHPDHPAIRSRTRQDWDSRAWLTRWLTVSYYSIHFPSISSSIRHFFLLVLGSTPALSPFCGYGNDTVEHFHGLGLCSSQQLPFEYLIAPFPPERLVCTDSSI